MIYLANAAQILIEFIFGILISLVVLRVLLQAVHANFYNPICQLVYKATNPVFIPMRRVIPAWRSLDMAGVFLAYILELIKCLIIFLLAGVKFSVFGLLTYSVAELLDFLLMLTLWIIIIRAILSFMSADRSNSLVPLIHQLSEPILRPIRHRLPLLSGFDFSPLVAILAISLLRVLVVRPLLDLASYIS